MEAHLFQNMTPPTFSFICTIQLTMRPLGGIFTILNQAESA